MRVIKGIACALAFATGTVGCAVETDSATGSDNLGVGAYCWQNRFSGADFSDTHQPADAEAALWNERAGRQVTYTAELSTGKRIVMLENLDGDYSCRLTGGRDDFAASWSEDGTRYAFFSNRSGSPDLYLVDTQDRSRWAQSMALGCTELGLTWNEGYASPDSADGYANRPQAIAALFSPAGDHLIVAAKPDAKGPVALYSVPAVEGGCADAELIVELPVAFSRGELMTSADPFGTGEAGTSAAQIRYDAILSALLPADGEISFDALVAAHEDDSLNALRAELLARTEEAEGEVNRLSGELAAANDQGDYAEIAAIRAALDDAYAQSAELYFIDYAEAAFYGLEVERINGLAWDPAATAAGEAEGLHLAIASRNTGLTIYRGIRPAGGSEAAVEMLSDGAMNASFVPARLPPSAVGGAMTFADGVSWEGTRIAFAAYVWFEAPPNVLVWDFSSNLSADDIAAIGEDSQKQLGYLGVMDMHAGQIWDRGIWGDQPSLDPRGSGAMTYTEPMGDIFDMRTQVMAGDPMGFGACRDWLDDPATACGWPDMQRIGDTEQGRDPVFRP